MVIWHGNDLIQPLHSLMSVHNDLAWRLQKVLSVRRQTKLPQCGIFQTKVNMSCFKIVQQSYNKTTCGIVWRTTAGCQYTKSLLLLEGLGKSSKQMGWEHLITHYRLIYARLQLKKKIGLRVPGSFFLSSIWSQTGLCYISRLMWPHGKK